MFSLFERKKANSASAKLRKILDLTTDLHVLTNESRVFDRCRRTLPVLVTPWRGKDSTSLETREGIALDLSDGGMRILFFQLPEFSHYIVSLLAVGPNAESFHFLGEIRSCNRLSLNIYSVGYQANEIVDCRDLKAELREFFNHQMIELTKLVADQHQPTA